MVKRGLSKSMKKRISALMNKKKLTVKDKKFLAKIQKGGEWLKPWTWFSSPAPTSPSAPATSLVEGPDAHKSINEKLEKIEGDLCKVCKKIGADCNCPAELGETVSESPNTMEDEEEDTTPKNDGDGNSIQPQPNTPPIPSRMPGGSKSKKNKLQKNRRRGSKSKKMSCLW